MPVVSPKELLSGNDVPAQAELLLNLLNDAAAGRDVSGLVSEVAEVRIYIATRSATNSSVLGSFVSNNPSSVERLSCPQQQTKRNLLYSIFIPVAWLQYYIAAGVGHVHVKKLAYDVCKAVQLSDLDYEYIASGIKVTRYAVHQQPFHYKYACFLSTVSRAALEPIGISVRLH
jgi:hypothetical protein